MQRRTSEDWRELIQSWQTSDLTQKQFCAEHSIAYSAFHYWFKKFRKPEATPEGVGFASVKVTGRRAATEGNGVVVAELVMPDGRRVNFFQGIDLQFLRDLLS